jgi:hypothetical protein
MTNFGVVHNFTQHPATPDQAAQGVQDLCDADRTEVAAHLTFNDIPTVVDQQARAALLVAIARKVHATTVMLGGAPFFMGTLERAFLRAGIRPVYAFSRRETSEYQDGSSNVIKTNVFKHVGFVEV